LAREALDDIYLQLSPDRVQISSDSKPGGADDAELSPDRTPMQVQASNETALLLENLLVFYDRLAEQIPSDSQVTLESAIASRRVGDIRQRLGQVDQAERDYTRAVQKLKALITWPDADVTIRTQLARTHNEIGNVRSARLEFRRAYESHVEAFSILQSVRQTSGSAEEYRYELARTLYFLAGKRLSGLGNRRGRDADENVAGPGPHHYKSTEYREWAISILDELVRENPNAPDYRFLLALCHRLSGIGHAWGRSSTGAEGRQRAIRILEELKAQYPDVADYRYELGATYASVHVGLYPWEERSAVSAEAERSLLKAIDESQWLVTYNPTIPEYARSHALILAKLGAVCWENERLAEAEDFFQKALRTQGTIIIKFPDLPSHNQVFLEFVRLRLGQVGYERYIELQHPNAVDKSRELLEKCIENLTELMERPELAEDRLAWTSLPIAYDALSHVFAEIGENEMAEQAKKNGEAVRNRMPDRRRHPWRQ
jgi:tetratricopeptide (TPR) repeat protein